MLVDYGICAMETSSFNLHQTIDMIVKAINAVVCHMLFDFAVHGLVMTAILISIGAFFFSRKHPFAPCIFTVAKRIAIFSLLLSVPGVISLLIARHLPDAGVFNFNSIGLLCFWSLISVHLVFEEINTTIVKENKIKETEAKS